MYECNRRRVADDYFCSAFSGPMNFFEFLRQANDRNFFKTQTGEFGTGRAELSLLGGASEERIEPLLPVEATANQVWCTRHFANGAERR